MKAALGAESALPRCCVVSNFCFQWVPLCSDSGVGDGEILQKRQHQDWVTDDVTVVHVPKVRQASVRLQHMLRVMGTSKLFLGHQAGSVLTAISLQGLLADGCSSTRVDANPGKGARRLPRGDASWPQFILRL